jgi:murein DD-endopeptidase MepM/ murein hydrolase activator NlpD
MTKGVRPRSFVIGLLLLSNLALATLPVKAESPLSETRRKLRAARARLMETRRSDAELLGVIHQLGGQLNSTRARLAAAEANLDRISAMIAGEQRRLEKLDALRKQRLALVKDRARAMYILGPGMGVDAILSSDSIDEFINRTSTLDFALRFDKVVMDDLARIADQSRKARAALTLQLQRVADARSEIAQRAGDIAEILQTKEVAEASLANKLDAYRAEVAALEREQARIVALIRSRQSHSTGRVSRRGFIWPIRGPITSPYGPRWGGFHTGIDINCDTGDRIVAAKAGRVIAAEWGGGYGRMVIIDHGNGVSTLYAHNSVLYVRQGQSVARGQRITACGATGNATGDHLHFEVRINGDHTDPRPFLP